MYCGAGESVGARVNPESLVYLDVCLGISVLIKRGCTLGVSLVCYRCSVGYGGGGDKGAHVRMQSVGWG